MRTTFCLLHLLPCLALAAPALAQDDNDEPGVDTGGDDDDDLDIDIVAAPGEWHISRP